MPKTVGAWPSTVRSRNLVSSNPSGEHGPRSVHTTLGSTPKTPSRLRPCGRTSRCESRCRRRPASGTADAYLPLPLLPHRLARPHGLSLDGVFGVLPNVVWTDRGPCSPEGFEETRLRLRTADGHAPTVYGIDKFPRMVDYVVPSGVRIADADRVRLGAHLAEGTTVMHEGFVNFNAGTLGVSMIEGRVSAGVVVDDGSDIGGGASIMGTLSGGG